MNNASFILLGIDGAPLATSMSLSAGQSESFSVAAAAHPFGIVPAFIVPAFIALAVVGKEIYDRFTGGTVMPGRIEIARGYA
jgi:hypothetical protein